MSYIKTLISDVVIVTAIFCAVFTVASLAEAKKKPEPVPHVMVFDPIADKYVPLDVPDGTEIYVFGQDGIEEGVNAGFSSDHKAILIVPKSFTQPDLQRQKPEDQKDDPNIHKS